MAGLSKNSFIFMNILTLLISIVMILQVFNLWPYGLMGLIPHKLGTCSPSVKKEVIYSAILLSILAVLGLIAFFSCSRVMTVLYLCEIVAVIVFFFGNAMSWSLISNKGFPQLEKAKANGIQEFSEFYRWEVNENNRKHITNCAFNSETCDSLTREELLSKDSQFDCCRPPQSCDFIYENATTWIAPKWSIASNQSECGLWSNDKDKKCFRCESCKLSYLHELILGLGSLIGYNFSLLF